MFRCDEIFIGNWREKTVEAMQRRRFDLMVSRLPPLSEQRLQTISSAALIRRIEESWQEIEKKPMRSLQMMQLKESVLRGIELHADCLSMEEHHLVERALILGGSAPIEDAQELEAAQALSLRLWASVGMEANKPRIELERFVMQPAAVAMSRREHEQIRTKLEVFHANLLGLLYRTGAADDRLPQQTLLRDVLQNRTGLAEAKLLARRYLWSSFDCIDYEGGVMLLHPALADPRALLNIGRRPARMMPCHFDDPYLPIDILPEEVPLQDALERTIQGALREGLMARDVARDIRFLCKQGAPMEAMGEVLQASLIVQISLPMRCALENMFYMTPKWIQSSNGALQ